VSKTHIMFAHISLIELSYMAMTNSKAPQKKEKCVLRDI
jgi:hypothetical protein